MALCAAVEILLGIAIVCGPPFGLGFWVGKNRHDHPTKGALATAQLALQLAGSELAEARLALRVAQSKLSKLEMEKGRSDH